ncbi:MAG: M20/M25/M40 family metallo-hydrolase, partial [Saprospiraceae bacterium]|nr:M20/M25/M40 family metallo-hydrolase [Saprospiraceae bacterium]
RPMPMGIEVSTSIENEIRRDVSQNVIAKIPGTDRADEYLIYSSHWDHMGIGAPVEGDSIYNGAMDNASGLATMLAVAKEFAEQEQKPSRTVIFLAVTAEEQGLLGSEWYAKHPLYPIENTVANLNKDGANVIGEMNDLTITGYGQSTLDDLAAEVAAKQDRYIAPEQFPEKGSFFRSDHFNFARVGVPAFYANGSGDHRIHGKEYAKSKSKEYVEKNYHRPSDEYTDDWILSGIVQDAELYFNMGWRLATEPIYPQWKEGSEFKHLRELKK